MAHARVACTKENEVLGSDISDTTKSCHGNEGALDGLSDAELSNGGSQGRVGHGVSPEPAISDPLRPRRLIQILRGAEAGPPHAAAAFDQGHAWPQLPKTILRRIRTRIPFEIKDIEDLYLFITAFFEPYFLLPVYILTWLYDPASVWTRLAFYALCLSSFVVFAHSWNDQETNYYRVETSFCWERELALVTGGSDGLGAQYVQTLAGKGVKVAIFDISPPRFPLPDSVCYFQVDVTSSDAIAAAALDVRKTFGQEPTILINNAGILPTHTILEGSDASNAKIFEVNTLSHYKMAREFLPRMIRTNHGMVVTIASQAGFISVPNMVAYCASKAAAVSFHEGLTSELRLRYKSEFVRTVLVAPGFMNTGLISHMSNCRASFLHPFCAPDKVVEATAKKIFAWKSGRVLLPNTLTGIIGVLYRALPYRLVQFVEDQAAKATNTTPAPPHALVQPS